VFAGGPLHHYTPSPSSSVNQHFHLYSQRNGALLEPSSARPSRCRHVETGSDCLPRHLTYCIPSFSELNDIIQRGGTYLSGTGGRAKAWCLLIHAEVSVSLSISQLSGPTSGVGGAAGAAAAPAAEQGLRLFHFSAQPEPFLTQNTPYTLCNTP
jgi:hypothetical protein